MLHLQQNTHTSINRYEAHIRTAKARLAATKPGQRLRVLSFGCSVGDECATLRAHFPDALIYGADINTNVLEIAKRTVGHFADIFLSDEEELTRRAPFDLIICASTLCIHPSPQNFQAHFSVGQFDNVLSLLDSCCAPAGIIVVINASYHFVGSATAKGYTTIRSDVVEASGFVDVFNRDGSIFLKCTPSANGYVYMRGYTAEARDDELIADSIFEKRRTPNDPEILSMRLSPAPDDLDVISSFLRSSVDYAPNVDRFLCLNIIRRWQFCSRRSTGEYGHAMTIEWSSLLQDDMYHIREPVWVPMSIGFTPTNGAF